MLKAESEEPVPMLRAGELEIAIVRAVNKPEGHGDLCHGIDLHHTMGLIGVPAACARST